jgi:uncharacterized protein (DUF362 family)
MKRRDFLVSGASAGMLAGALAGSGGVSQLAAAVLPQQGNFDLVAVRDGEPDVMFDRAIASLGGMSKFVKKGQKVVVKPNIGWDVSPERAGNTNPKLVGRIVKHCMDAGASEVYVFDNTCDAWNLCYKNSGIEKAVKDNGGKIVPGNNESAYKPIQIPKGKSLKDAKVHELILSSDVLINVHVLKHHSSASLSLAMKNLMGIVWDRRFWHRNDLHQCIADLITWRKPDLNIIDGYRVMMRNGPRGVSEADVVVMKQLIVSHDIVAADAAAALIFGSKPEDIPHIRIAHEMKLGTMKLDTLKINRIKI